MCLTTTLAAFYPLYKKMFTPDDIEYMKAVAHIQGRLTDTHEIFFFINLCQQIMKNTLESLFVIFSFKIVSYINDQIGFTAA